MNRPAALLAIASAIAIAGTYLALRGGGGDARESASPGAPEASTEDAREAAALATPEVPTTAPESARAETPSAPGEASLEVALLDKAGMPLDGVEVLVVVAGEFSGASAAPELARATTSTGAHVFEGLPAGAQPIVEARAAAPWSPSRARLEAPLAGRARVEVVLPFDGTIVAGRVTDAAGAPLRGAEVAPEYTWVAPTGTSSRRDSPIRTSEAGRFVHRVEKGAEGLGFPSGRPARPGAATEVDRGSYELRLRASRGEEELLSDPAALPLPPWPEVLDVGALELAPLPVLVAGKVVDQDGAPVARALITVSAPADLVLERYRAGGAGSFRPIHLQEYSRDDGSFSMYSPRTDFPLVELAARHPEHLLEQPLRLVPGTEDALVVMLRGGFLEGSFAGLSPEQRGSLRLALSDPSGEFGGTSTSFGTSLPDDHYRLGRRSSSQSGEEFFLVQGDEFGFGPLRQGTYRFRARFGEHEPFLVVEGLEVRAGETCRDPRLQAIDLSSLLQSVTLTVLDAQGERVETGYVLFGAPGNLDRVAVLGAGTASLLAPELPIDLVVRAPDHREAVLTGVTGDREVVLEPGVPVELRLPPSTVVPAGWELRAIWAEPRATGFPPFYDSPLFAVFDEQGVARMTAPRSGLLELELEARKNDGNSTTIAGVGLPPEDRVVEVSAVTGTRVIELHVTTELLAKELGD